MKPLRAITRRRRIATAGLALATASLLLLTACTPSAPVATATATAAAEDPAWQKVLDDANAEGKVVLYLSITGVDDRIKDAWAKAYPGISLEIFRTGSAELLARLDQEKTTGAAGADVTVHADAGWYEKSEAWLLDPEGPAYTDLWADSTFSHDDGKYVLVDGAPLGIVYNTDLIKQLKADPIKDYKDILQPELKDYIGITPSSNAAAAEQWWYTVSDSLGGAAALKKLSALNPVPYTSLTPMVQAVAAGELAVGAYASTAVVNGLKDQGAPIEVVIPEPAVGGGHFVAAVEWATHPNAAKVFRNWLLSPEGQIALNGPGDLYTPLAVADIPGAPDTMTSIPDTMFITDGVITSEQDKWMLTQWRPVFG